MLTSLLSGIERTDWIDPDWRLPDYPADFAERYPYYQAVPKGFRDNLAFREVVLRDGMESSDAREEYWLACRRDPLFWINTFGYVVEPRGRDDLVTLPCVTWPFQDCLISAMDEALGVRDICVEKSRDMAVTWSTLFLLVHRWQFYGHQFFGVVSRNQDLVDDLSNPDCLFWKMRFIVSNQPGWLRPAGFDISKHSKLLNLTNPELEGSVDGSSTTADSMRGGRKRGVMIDEAASIPNATAFEASIAQVTDSRLYVSTPKGAVGPFYEKTRPGSGTEKVSLPWVLHPEHARGLWFDAEGQPRSPWYDEQCKKLNYNRVLIAQELGLNYQASDYQFFDEKEIRRLVAETAKEPLMVGDLRYEVDRDERGRVIDVRPIEFIEQSGGGLRLWCALKGDGRPVAAPYGIGADISMGTGASNSALSVGDKSIGRKVAEYVNARIDPAELAHLAIALSRWFGNGAEARLIWERNGPGNIFRNALLGAQFLNYHVQKNEKKQNTPTKNEPGWQSGRDEKVTLLSEYRGALFSGRIINPSLQALKECSLYICKPNGQIAHAKAERTDDPTAARDNHGDVVIADALMWMVFSEVSDEISEPDEVPPDCWAARWKAIEDAKRPKEY